MFQSDKELPVVETPSKHYCLPKWRAIVDAAEKRGGFSETESGDAGCWDACACWEAKERYDLPYDRVHTRYMGPSDPTIYQLGRDFSWCVDKNNYEGCREVLTAIEERLAELDAQRE